MKDEIARLKELSDGFQELGQQAGFVKQQEAELTKQYTSAINSITKYSTSVSSLEQLMEDQIGMLTRLKKLKSKQLSPTFCLVFFTPLRP